MKPIFMSTCTFLYEEAASAYNTRYIIFRRKRVRENNAFIYETSEKIRKMLNNCGSFRNNRRFSEARYTLFFPTSIFLNSLSSYNSYNNKKNMHTTEKTQRRDDGFVNRAAHKTFVSLIVSRKKRLCGMRTTIDERLTLSSTFALGWTCTFVTLTFHSRGPLIMKPATAYESYIA